MKPLLCSACYKRRVIYCNVCVGTYEKHGHKVCFCMLGTASLLPRYGVCVASSGWFAKNKQIFNAQIHTEVNVTHQLAHVLHAWSGCYIIKAVCSAAVFQPVWQRHADTSQRSIFTSVCAVCARTIIIITDTAALLVPTIKGLWENSVQIQDWNNLICQEDLIICCLML